MMRTTSFQRLGRYLSLCFCLLSFVLLWSVETTSAWAASGAWLALSRPQHLPSDAFQPPGPNQVRRRLAKGTVTKAEKAQVSAPSLDQIQRLHREGKALFARKSYDMALQRYRRTYRLLQQAYRMAKPKRKPRLKRFLRAYLATLASAHHWSRDYLQARRFYTRCTKESDQKRQILCRRYLKVVNKHLVQMQIETRPGISSFVLSDVDRKPVSMGKTPLKIWLKPGTYWVTVSLPGHVEIRKRLVLHAGARPEFHYEMERQRCPKPAKSGVDEIVMRAPRGFIAPNLFPQTNEVGLLQSTPGKPMVSKMPTWQIVAIVSGIVVAVASLAASTGYAIYRSNNDSYAWNPGIP